MTDSEMFELIGKNKISVVWGGYYVSVGEDPYHFAYYKRPLKTTDYEWNDSGELINVTRRDVRPDEELPNTVYSNTVDAFRAAFKKYIDKAKPSNEELEQQSKIIQGLKKYNERIYKGVA